MSYKPPLPINAEEIFVEWATAEGGLGVVAFTDDRGLPFIGTYPLRRIGEPMGFPCWFRRGRMMTGFLIGFRDKKPLIINIDVEVSARGISLIILVPLSVAPHNYKRHTSAKWGSGLPRYGKMLTPTQVSVQLNTFVPEVMYDR